MAGEKLRLIKCPSCAAPLQIRAPGQTISLACSYCGTVIDTTNEDLKILSQAHQAIRIEPVIPIGQRGKLRGHEWQAIGFMQRSDGSGVYKWQEYLLFNPYRGFRWLTEQNGHWNYVIMTKERPRRALGSLSRQKAYYLNKEYDLFEKGIARVTFVLGEFYWRVKVGETVDVEDYTSPPEMLSLEKNAEEQIWSIAEYVPADEIRSSFQIQSKMPLVQGVAPNQPGIYDEKKAGIGTYWSVFCAILVVLQFFGCTRAENKSVYSDGFQFRLDQPVKTLVTPPFEMGGGSANVEVHLTSPVVNDWFSVQAELVNDSTGETYEFEQGVEYYYGSDSDGPWSEGSQGSDHLISAVPAGTYHLNLDPSGGRPTDWGTPAGAYTFQITVKRDVPTWSNFFWALALISILPSIVLWRNRQFEASRWANSDYSPYQTSGDDE